MIVITAAVIFVVSWLYSIIVIVLHYFEEKFTDFSELYNGYERTEQLGLIGGVLLHYPLKIICCSLFMYKREISRLQRFCYILSLSYVTTAIFLYISGFLALIGFKSNQSNGLIQT